MKDGLHVEWSNVNQAWFLMWMDQVLRVFSEKADAEAEMERLLPISDEPDQFHVDPTLGEN